MQCAYKSAMVNQSYHVSGDFLLRCMIHSAAFVAHNKHGYGVGRMARLMTGASQQMNAVFDRYAGDEPDEYEQVSTSIGSMIGELRGYGIDFAAERKRLAPVDPFTQTWHPKAVCEMHDDRAEFIGRVELGASAVHASILLRFYEDEGYREKRLRRLYEDLREDYNPFVVEYLRCSEKGDAAMVRMLEERKEKLEKCGLRLV